MPARWSTPPARRCWRSSPRRSWKERSRPNSPLIGGTNVAPPNDHAEPGPSADLAGYEVTIALGGGIAAYKVCQVVSRLVQRGCGVNVAMTAAATRFVTPLTFQALTA